jgi:hypothetical protein
MLKNQPIGKSTNCSMCCDLSVHCVTIISHGIITSILTTDNDPVVASQLPQTDLLAIQNWLKTWIMKANETKSTHFTFTKRRATCPPVHISDVQLPQSDDVKYLGLHLDRRLTWHKHIFTKTKTT